LKNEVGIDFGDQPGRSILGLAIAFKGLKLIYSALLTN
jgi:hypothetical protein